MIGIVIPVFTELNWSRQMQNSMFDRCTGGFTDRARPLMAPTGVHCRLESWGGSCRREIVKMPRLFRGIRRVDSLFKWMLIIGSNSSWDVLLTLLKMSFSNCMFNNSPYEEMKGYITCIFIHLKWCIIAYKWNNFTEILLE